MPSHRRYQPQILTDKQQQALEQLDALREHDFRECLQVIAAVLLDFADDIASWRKTSIEQMECGLNFNAHDVNRRVSITALKKDTAEITKIDQVAKVIRSI